MKSSPRSVTADARARGFKRGTSATTPTGDCGPNFGENLVSLCVDRNSSSHSPRKQKCSLSHGAPGSRINCVDT